MRADALGEIVGVSARVAARILRGFIEAGLAARFDGRFYLAETGIRRAANLSRIQPSIIRSRHGVYLRPRFRRQDLAHNDAVNRLVLAFAREGARVFGGWRGEVNIPWPDPAAARPAAARRRGSLRSRAARDRSRAARHRPLRGRGQAQSLPPRRRRAAGHARPRRLRDRARDRQIRRRRRLAADAGRQRGSGPRRPADQRAHGVDGKGSTGDAALPGLSVSAVVVGGPRQGEPRTSGVL